MRNFVVLFGGLMVVVYLALSVFLIFFAQSVLGNSYKPEMKWFGIVIGIYGLFRLFSMVKRLKKQTDENN